MRVEMGWMGMGKVGWRFWIEGGLFDLSVGWMMGLYDGVVVEDSLMIHIYSLVYKVITRPRVAVLVLCFRIPFSQWAGGLGEGCLFLRF